MIMFYTNQKRNSETVLKNQYKIKKKQFENLKKLKDLVGISKDIILNKNFRAKEFGILLNRNWELKKKINRLSSNKLVDKYYNQALNLGAYGGKLLGAGNGGFLLFIASKSSQKKIANKLNKLKKMYIKFDYSGTRITYFDKSGEAN